MKVCPRCSELYPDDVARCPRDGAEVRAVLDPLIGRTVGGRYRLISRLGSGGMSAVYLARHVLIDRLMAIKTLRRDLSQDPVQRDRFLREARAVNRINHENIVEITDFGESDDGMVYLVMEYVPGESLLRLMQSEGPLAPLRALDVAEQIGHGLARAHQMGVVHRDLKPENVLVLQKKKRPDFVKILDFGIAKILDAPSLTGSQQIFGTPGYIAPEYIQSTRIDGRADLYSLGVILYEMVTGALPFDYEYPGDLLVKHVTDPPVPPRARDPRVPEAVEALVLRCLRKSPHERFRDAFQFVAEVAAVREALAAAGGAGPARTFTAPADAAGTPEAHPEDVDEGRKTLFDPVPAGAVAGLRSVGVDVGPPGASRRSPTQEIGRHEIPLPPAVDGIDTPLEVEMREAARRAREAPPQAPATPAEPRRVVADGLFGVRRWRARFDALAAAVDDLRAGCAPDDAVLGDLAHARGLLERLERAVSEVERHQEAVEDLGEAARALRASVGASIDAAGRELSARRGILERLVQRREELRARREVTRRRAREDGTQTGKDDAVLWELATVEERLRDEARACDELEARLAELRESLETHNERIEREQGALVARLDGEMLQLEPLAMALRTPLERVEQFVRTCHERVG
jgi:serine/threonine-protein kinase